MEERGVTVDGTTHALPRAVHGARDAEPGRAQGDVPAARGAGRPLPALPAHGVPDARTTRRSCSSGSAAAIRSPRCAPSSTRGRSGRVRAAVREVHVADDVAGYIVALARATRESPLMRLGASPRASLALQHAAQAAAALAGRDFVIPDDVQGLVGAGARAPAAARPRRRHRRAHRGRRPRRGRSPACRCRRSPGSDAPAALVRPEALVRLRSILWACLAGLAAATLLHSAALVVRHPRRVG